MNGPRSATRSSTWSPCRGPCQGCGRRRGTGRIADERGDHAVQLGREGCRTSLESRENEKAKTRSSPWRVGAHERLKPSYDCDLVFDDVEGAPDPVRGEPRTEHPTGCPTKSGPTTRWYVDCVSIWIYACADVTLNLRRVQVSPSICVVVDDGYDRNHISPSHVAEFCCSC